VRGKVRTPALDYPYLAFAQTTGKGQRLVVIDLRSGDYDVVASPRGPATLGRPALSHGLLAWTTTRPGGSRLTLLNLATKERRVLARSGIALYSFPALGARFVAWVEQRAGGMAALVVARRDGSQRRELLRLESRRRALFTTGLTGRVAYVTRWVPATGRARIVRLRF
jgi:hypothetical protein